MHADMGQFRGCILLSCPPKLYALFINYKYVKRFVFLLRQANASLANDFKLNHFAFDAHVCQSFKAIPRDLK